jgi:ribonuclease P protein component
MNQRLPKSLRIHQSSEIRKILTTGQKYIGNHIILYCSVSPTADPATRAGFLSPKRLGKAVKRNQFRRRMREVFRKHRMEIKGSHQILMMGRTSAIHADYVALNEDFLRLCRKARLLPS